MRDSGGSRKMRAGPFFEEGFTLIELMIVISIIAILLGIAAIRYDRVIIRSRETVLKQDLRSMREAIDSYTVDKEAAPQALDDLVTAHYLHSVPVDPITQQTDWVPHFSDYALTPDQAAGVGIDDVHSKSEAPSSDGTTTYNLW
jgi:general secretion pathway protein G